MLDVNGTREYVVCLSKLYGPRSHLTTRCKLGRWHTSVSKMCCRLICWYGEGRGFYPVPQIKHFTEEHRKPSLTALLCIARAEFPPPLSSRLISGSVERYVNMENYRKKGVKLSSRVNWCFWLRRHLLYGHLCLLSLQGKKKLEEKVEKKWLEFINNNHHQPAAH